MTDPTADAAKLLPVPNADPIKDCPRCGGTHYGTPGWCPMTQDRPPQYEPWVKAPSQNEGPDFSAVLAKIKDALTKDYGNVNWWKRRVEGTPLENDIPVRAATVAMEILTNANTRPQPAPPAGEPEPPFDQIAENLAYGGPRIPNSGGKADTDWIKTRIAEELKNVYRLGLAARPKVEDAVLPKGLVDALRCQRQIDEDGEEVAVNRQACDEAADLLERLAGELSNALTHHRVLDSCLKAQHELTKTTDAKLAEREAELAKADALVCGYVRPCDLGHFDEKIYHEIENRHAARQQQKASDEKDKS